MLYTDQAVERNRAVEATCWMLLKRYGILFRDVLTRETNLPKWRELQMACRRLEDRGEIRGGRFIDGFLGEQFALAGCGRIPARNPQTPTEWRDGHTVRCRPAEPGWNSCPRRSHPSHLGKNRHIPRWCRSPTNQSSRTTASSRRIVPLEQFAISIWPFSLGWTGWKSSRTRKGKTVNANCRFSSCEQLLISRK